MGIEQKAKAYDEALERAKQIRNGNPSSGTAIVVCEQIFPELRESEDERIRKYLIDELKVAKSVGELKFTIPQPTREECIAYLEKQKELFESGRGLYYYDGEKTTYCGYPATELNPCPQRNAGTTNWREYDDVESLYEQLLKLK